MKLAVKRMNINFVDNQYSQITSTSYLYNYILNIKVGVRSVYDILASQYLN